MGRRLIKLSDLKGENSHEEKSGIKRMGSKQKIELKTKGT